MGNIKYRHELKHYINLADYFCLRSRLRQVMKVDRHADGKGQYLIRSIYFDDFRDTALVEKISGINHREKFRIRYYNGDTSLIRLEKKMKNNGLTAKFSIPLSMDECLKILKGDIEWLKLSKAPLLNELYVKMNSGLYRPKTIVDYTREAYTYSAGNVRVTFDKSIKSGLFSTRLFDESLPVIETLNPQQIILEVKYDEYLPDVVADIIQTGERRAAAVSKYALCRIYG